MAIALLGRLDEAWLRTVLGFPRRTLCHAPPLPAIGTVRGCSYGMKVRCPAKQTGWGPEAAVDPALPAAPTRFLRAAGRALAQAP